jgi:lipoic acid synthetase
MVGLGERDDEILEAMRDLRSAQVDVVTLGQYLRPTPKHAPVERYVAPEQFAAYEREGYQMGFQFVASGPLVRSSYHAAEAFLAAAAATPSGARAEPQLPSHEGARPVVQPPRAEPTQLIRPESLLRR